jgi:mannose-6-phosphate isomerase-like protein (cupin superfamily)
MWRRREDRRVGDTAKLIGQVAERCERQKGTTMSNNGKTTTIDGAGYHVIRSDELAPESGRTVKFEGEPYEAGVSFFHVFNRPGEGPRLHRHPYPETWIVRSGRVIFRAGDEEIEAGPGDVVVAEAGKPHGFRNPGPDDLELVCIHAAGRMVQEWLED